MSSSVYIYHPYTDSYGIMVIVKRFMELCKIKGIPCEYITSLEGREKTDFIIPYGSTPAMELISKSYDTKMAFLVDAYSLGELNKIKFYASKGLFYKYDFLYSTYAYIRAVFEEKKLVRNYNHTMLVSQTDIDYLKRISGVKEDSSYVCVPNGANKVTFSPKSKSNKLRLGLLSSWDNRVSYEENDWFVRSYFKRLHKEIPDVELRIAGRGKYAENYKGLPGVVYVGEVASLDDFFKDIDVFIAANPKGCGILNRVLDAFAYNTIVLGYDKSFSGFTQMKDSYIQFTDYTSFKESVSFIEDNPEKVNQMIESASHHLETDFDWDKNYTQLVSFIEKL